MAISNRYKNILNNFIDSLNPESLPRPINEKLCKTSRLKDGLTRFPKKNCLYENVSASNKSLQLMPKTRNFQSYQRRDILPFGPKSKRA